jgi:YfiH family protein
MISVAIKGLTILQFNNLNCYPELLHFSTLRTGGLSTDNYSSLNLGLNSGDIRENVIANRNALCKALEINTDRFIFPKQAHSATVRVITTTFFSSGKEERNHFLHETDAIITTLKGVCIAVKTADCVPVLLYDPKQKVVSAIHAGWRGTAQNIVLTTIQRLVEEFGSDPADLIAGIGPSISPDVYEVGEDVHSQFDSAFYRDTNPVKTGKRRLDLWKANKHQLIQGGVSSDHIEIAKLCTWSDSDRFFSARRDCAKTGRMATGIMLR